MSETRVLFAGARVVDPASGRDEVTDVLIAGGLVAALGGAPGDAERIDCDGLVLAPGLVDLHTHLREPGYEHKETIETGTRAAATAGLTAVTSAAHTRPATDHARVVAEIVDKATA